MTKAELIEKIARSRDLPPDVTKKCIQQILDIAIEELAGYFARARVTRNQTPRFTFPGFGTFTKKKRSARKGVNPRTLEPMKIPASYTVDFKPGTELRRQLNGGVASRRRGAIDEPRQTSLALGDEYYDDDRVEEVAEVKPPAIVGRRLRERDEAEFDGLAEGVDPTLFSGSLELPAAPLQRVRARPCAADADKTG
ncbi:MAG: HU family DNA-binding protein [Nannocystaceae bacterium]|nr:HU family DNA-binding protein [Myxococcales bacterium]